jgi:nitrogen-specific signal transduction histidine kinase
VGAQAVKLYTAMENSSKLPADVIAHLRTLAHDLSNSLETILQAAYLLGEAEPEGKDKKWARMIDTAARDAARINREIRGILRSQDQSPVVGRQSGPRSENLLDERPKTGD